MRTTFADAYLAGLAKAEGSDSTQDTPLVGFLWGTVVSLGLWVALWIALSLFA